MHVNSQGVGSCISYSSLALSSCPCSSNSIIKHAVSCRKAQKRYSGDSLGPALVMLVRTGIFLALFPPHKAFIAYQLHQPRNRNKALRFWFKSCVNSSTTKHSSCIYTLSPSQYTSTHYGFAQLSCPSILSVFNNFTAFYQFKNHKVNLKKREMKQLLEKKNQQQQKKGK